MSVRIATRRTVGRHRAAARRSAVPRLAGVAAALALLSVPTVSALFVDVRTVGVKTQAAVAANATDANYYLYCANPAAGSPPANQSNVYLFTDGLESGSTGNRTQQAGAAWYPGWSYRKPVTLTAGQVSGTHTNFPVLISITDANLASGAKANGDDIVFTDGDGVTKLDHEIESYTSATGTLVAWVRKPTLSSGSNTMYLYYGNAGASNQQNADGTWDSSYLGVWHLNQNPAATAPQISDSSGNGANGTTNGSMAAGARVAAKVGDGLQFDGSNDYVSIPSLAGGTAQDNVTVETWFKAGSFANDNAGLVTRNQWSAGSVHFKLWSSAVMEVDPNGQPGVGASVTTGTWYQGAYTFTKSGNVVVYKNGSLVNTTTAGGTAWPATGIELGHEYNTYTAGNRYLTGVLDEARISNVVRSSQWLATEYSNHNNPAGFETLGSQENASTSSDFTAATDQAHSGTYSLKAAPGTGVTRWLVANGLDYADVHIDAWWRLSTTTNVTVSQGVRAGSGGSVNQYEGTLNTTPRWTTGKDINGTVTTAYTAPADATCPTANTWAKVSVEISGTQWRSYCNDTQVAPAAGFSTTGGELTSGSVGLRVANIPAGQNWWVDDVVVRRFVNPEPTLTPGTVDRS